jgi:hypothetical protein
VRNEEITVTVCTHGNIDAKVSTVIGYRIKYFPTSVREILTFFITYRIILQPFMHGDLLLQVINKQTTNSLV